MNEKQIEIRRQRNLRKNKKQKIKLEAVKKEYQYNIFSTELDKLIIYYEKQIEELSNYNRICNISYYDTNNRLFYFRKKMKKIYKLHEDVLFLTIIEKGYIDNFIFKEIINGIYMLFIDYKDKYRICEKGLNYKEEIQKRWNIRKEKRELNSMLIKVSQKKKRSRL